MSRTIPANFTMPGELRLSTGQAIYAADMLDLLEAQNWLLARLGARAGGVAYDAGGGLSAAATGGPFTLDESFVSRLRRDLEGDVVAVGFRCFAENLDVDMHVYRRDDAASTLIATISASTSGSNAQWLTASDTIAIADVCESGNAANARQLLEYVIEYDSRDKVNSGTLAHLDVLEWVITDATLLPHD